ncbi:MAG: hypothetical protein VYA60_08070 [Pseudomonadota bacterium]|nr:hypothetical protein [Pseudomonadota bacterium]
MKTHKRITIGLISGLIIGIVASAPILMDRGGSSSHTLPIDRISDEENDRMIKEIEALQRLSQKLEREKLEKIKELERVLDEADPKDKAAIEAKVNEMLDDSYSDDFKRQLVLEHSSDSTPN